MRMFDKIWPVYWSRYEKASDTRSCGVDSARSKMDLETARVDDNQVMKVDDNQVMKAEDARDEHPDPFSVSHRGGGGMPAKDSYGSRASRWGPGSSLWLVRPELETWEKRGNRERRLRIEHCRAKILDLMSSLAEIDLKASPLRRKIARYMNAAWGLKNESRIAVLSRWYRIGPEWIEPRRMEHHDAVWQENIEFKALMESIIEPEAGMKNRIMRMLDK